MTPLYVKTRGVNPAIPVTATFTGASGFTVTLNAVRIAPDGTVVVPVPQPIDPKTGATTSARLTMLLTQKNQTTAPVTLDVQDIPQLSELGVNLGVVSRTYLNYETMALGQHLGALRALQNSAFNHVDMTQEQANVSKLLQAVIRARNDVDRVMTNNALVIPAGSANSTPIVFDRNALAAMDRSLAMYLISMGPVYQPPGTTSSAHARRPAAAAPGQRRPSADVSKLATALEWLKHVNDVAGPVASFRSGINADNNFDRALSFAQAAAGVVVVGAAVAAAVGGGAPAAAVGAFAAGFGAGLSAFAVGVDIGHIASDVGVVIHASEHSAAEVSSAYADMRSSSVGAVTDGVGVVLAGIDAGVIFKGLSTAGNVALQSTALVGTALGQYQLKAPEQDEQTSLSALGPLASSMLPPGEGFTDALGNFTVSNSQGPILSGLSGVEVGQPPFASGIADPFGQYDITLPTGSAFDTSGQSVFGFDPVTGSILSSTPIDLSKAKPGVPINVNPMSGTCNDTDANAPDSDDPDCD
jgi:hypothetical protein